MPGTYKIWFSKTPQHPLGGDVNKSRLLKHRANFQGEKLSLLVNLEDLSKENRKFVEDFCK